MRRGAAAAVDDGVARIAVLVDEAFGGPGEIVFQAVARIDGQRTNTHFNGIDSIERAS